MRRRKRRRGRRRRRMRRRKKRRRPTVFPRHTNSPSPTLRPQRPVPNAPPPTPHPLMLHPLIPESHNTLLVSPSPLIPLSRALLPLFPGLAVGKVRAGASGYGLAPANAGAEPGEQRRDGGHSHDGRTGPREPRRPRGSGGRRRDGDGQRAARRRAVVLVSGRGEWPAGAW